MSDGHTERLRAAVAGRYRLERKLGEGGMAAVYLAEDLKHARKVALKVLRPELAAVLGAERFLAEIRTTANLQHPHILPLFDSGEANGYLYYVMPFIEGETLRDKLDREGQLGIEESIGIAEDVASALDYAHRQGVIHRDIKPGNILLHDGRPVVADFGIALAVSAAGGGRMTETGLSLGTPHYMSPEQASADQDVTPRSDVYSLGCVLYEMLAGQPPHTGPSAQSILVRILTEDPRPLTDARRTVPPHVAAAVAKAIEKLPADRFGSARAFADALDNPGFAYRAGGDGVPAALSAAGGGAEEGASSRLRAAATVLLAVTTVVFGWMALRPGDASPPERGGVVSFVLSQAGNAALYPIVGNDGSIAYQSQTGGLDLLAPGTVDPVPLTGTEGVYRGVFSPDARWLAFMQETDGGGYALRRMPATGGPASTLWETRALFGPTLGAVDWGGGGWIYVSTGGVVGRIPEGGGQLDTLFALDRGFVGDLALLPNARGLLLTVGSSPTSPENHTVVLDLEDGDTSTVTESGFGARWVSSGHVIYATGEGALYALPFDPRRLDASGAPILAEDDAFVMGGLVAGFDVSSNGTLVYTRGPSSAEGGGRGYALVSPEGDIEVLPLEPTDHQDADLSPDGTRIAYTRDDNIYIYHLDRGSNEALTQDGEGRHNPIWSPDGAEIVFSQRGEGDPSERDLYVRRSDGTGSARLVSGIPGVPQFATQWLPDGAIISYTTARGSGGGDIYRVSSSGQEPAEPVLEADWAEAFGAVSPDGRWFAYRSDEDGGTRQLILRHWPDLGDKTQLTSGNVDVGLDPGFSPGWVWGADSRTIYLQRGLRLWTVTFEGEDPATAEVQETGVDLPGELWDLRPDGRLLVSTFPGLAAAIENSEETQLVVTSNWTTALEERLGR